MFFGSMKYRLMRASSPVVECIEMPLERVRRIRLDSVNIKCTYLEFQFVL